MSDGKFASITSALFVRKGEAGPSMVSPVSVRSVPAYTPRPPHPVRRHTDLSPRGDQKRRLVVTLTAEEYRRLGIIAAKKNATRQELLRGVLFERLDAFAKEQGRDCACISSGTACDCASAETGSPPMTAVA